MHDSADDEGSLIRAAICGNEGAFSRLYDRYRSVVAKRLSHLLGPSGDVDDALQETFLRRAIMIAEQDSGGDLHPTPAGWLARARAQAQELAEVRARQAKPLQRSDSPRRRRPVVLSWAAALLLLLLASGAWAWVARAIRERRGRAAPPPLTDAAQRTAPSPRPRVERPLAPVTASTNHRNSLASQPATVSSSKTPGVGRPMKFDEGEGELILVVPSANQPPLFSPKDWKRR